MTSSDVAAMIERLGKIRHNEIAREAAAMLARLQAEREELQNQVDIWRRQANVMTQAESDAITGAMFGRGRP